MKHREVCQYTNKRSVYSIFLGNRLHIINLSQQSDAVDLLGGYKPFDSVLLLKQIYRDFSIEQITNDHIDEVQVNRKNNIKINRIFNIKKLIQSKQYKEAIRRMIKYTDKNSSLRNQLIQLRESFKLNNRSALIFRFIEV